MVQLSERARRYIAKCPAAVSGQGGHDATFHVAAILVNGFALPEHDALALLREFNGRCVPPWKESELVHKIMSAAKAQHAQPRGHLVGKAKGRMQNAETGTTLTRPAATLSHPMGEGHGEGSGAAGRGLPLANAEGGSTSPRPSPQRGEGDVAAAAERWLKGFRCGEADLRDASREVLDGDWRFDGAVLARALYAPGEMVNFVTEFAEYTEKSGDVKARPMGKGVTLERDALVARFAQNGSDTSQAGGWLRMNPVDNKGIGDVNVTACRFALLESDTLPMDLQLSLFAKLPLPIAAILSSGGRSVHAWVKLDARDAEEYRNVVPRLLEILAKFGVDGKNKNPSRLSRLPGARRVLGAVGDGVQRLLYVNPQPEERSIL